MNQKIGYLRNFADNLSQYEKLKSAGCTLIFEDKEKELLQLRVCLESLNPGDVLVVTSLEILGRNMVGIITTITSIARKKAFLISMSEQLDSSQESGDALVRMCQLLMGCEQSFVREKNRKGLAASRARGRLGGRKMKLSWEDIKYIKELLSHPENRVSDIAQKYGVSRTTIYKYVGVIVPDRAL
ncbi:recombinase family protein [Pectobacterium aroidearum]|uniref:recombinase family protein n=1 Tax=Pectobacterium aroidearum TaxID=1201031 RepID=UPI00211587CD|nr:recombinase family protein [Pectobacterium aroidearum]UUE35768.1 recombinase family protein [Pectobacterium aroidearum]UUE40143.1 recombinase family protein [Pectobacterium aroidearum]UUE44472.1 recombinase family protein [Pectobacterium aroidearum]UUE48692.1 recombinase family protein [Pectobacterium aroidearum]UUE52896.1 recombinase family protein [Pectobacterium aroidearum]